MSNFLIVIVQDDEWQKFYDCGQLTEEINTNYLRKALAGYARRNVTWSFLPMYTVL